MPAGTWSLHARLLGPEHALALVVATPNAGTTAPRSATVVLDGDGRVFSAPTGRLVAILIEDPETVTARPATEREALSALAAASVARDQTRAPLRTPLRLLRSIGGAHVVPAARDADAMPVAARGSRPRPVTLPPRPDERTIRGGDALGLWRAHATDAAMVDDGALLLLVQDSVIVLDGESASVWCAADGGSRAALAAALAERSGSPIELADAAIAAAIERGLLRDRPTWRPRGDLAWEGDGTRVTGIALQRPDAPPTVLEGPAATIWAALCADGAATTATILERVAAAFEVPPTTIEPDVRAFLQQLVDEAWITA